MPHRARLGPLRRTLWESSTVTSRDPIRPNAERGMRGRAAGHMRADRGHESGRGREPVDGYPRRSDPADRERHAPSHAGPRPLARSSLWQDDDHSTGAFSGPQPLRARWDPVPPPRSRVGRQRTRTERRRTSVGWFIHHYGWRAYALPVLVVLTVVTIIGITRGATEPHASHEVAGEGSGVVTVTLANSVVTTVTVAGTDVTTTVGEPRPDPTGEATLDGTASGPLDVTAAHPANELPPSPPIDSAEAFRGVTMGLLPPGAAYAETGAGTFHIVPGTSEPFGTGSDHRTFTIEVEDGIQSTAADSHFADAVMDVLSSETSWIGTGSFTLRRVDSGNPDFRVTLASQMTTRKADFCGWQVQLEASCYNYLPGRVVINDARWMRGAYSFNGDLTSYRVYAINHEVGHALGFNHEACPSHGALAPIMMQQSWSTADDDIAVLNPGGSVPADGKICRANPFVTGG